VYLYITNIDFSIIGCKPFLLLQPSLAENDYFLYKYTNIL